MKGRFKRRTIWELGGLLAGVVLLAFGVASIFMALAG